MTIPKLPPFVERHARWFLALLVVAVVVVVWRARRARQQRLAEVIDIQGRIQHDLGADGGPDIRTLLSNVRPVTPNAGGDQRAQAIIDAEGKFNDDEAAVFAALSGLSIWQIKAVDAACQRLSGKDLDGLLKPDTGPDRPWYDPRPRTGGFLTADEYARALAIVQQAKQRALSQTKKK